MNIPSNYQAIMPYLILNKAADFITFTQNVFGAVELARVMRDAEMIVHGEVMISSCTIMFADATDQFSTSAAGLFIYVEDADVTFAKALQEGATLITPVSDQPYGRSGGVKDPFGNTWWITSTN